jgi:hypothetical protein
MVNGISHEGLRVLLHLEERTLQTNGYAISSRANVA